MNYRVVDAAIVAIFAAVFLGSFVHITDNHTVNLWIIAIVSFVVAIKFRWTG